MKKTLLIAMSLLSVLGCSAQTPQGLESFSYSENDGRAFSESCEAKKVGADSVQIKISQDGIERIFMTGADAMDRLEKILEDNNYKQPKGRYVSKMVLDGTSWNVEVAYKDGSTFSSGGYHKWPSNARNAIRAIEGFFNQWRIKTPEDLTDFRFELYTKGQKEVLTLNHTELFTGIYFRWLGDWDGWNYYCADSSKLVNLGQIINSYSLPLMPQTPIDDEDVKRDRWLVEGVYKDGSKIQVVEYIEEPDFNFRRAVENIFKEETDRISKLGPAQGEHVRTTYKANGKPSQRIRYSGEGVVCGGYDYDHPLNDF